MSSVWLAVTYIGGWIVSMRIFGYFWKNRKLGNIMLIHVLVVSLGRLKKNQTYALSYFFLFAFLLLALND